MSSLELSARPVDGSTIRTPDQRLRVFVSSTMKELESERRAVTDAIRAMRLHPVLFELGARPHPPKELYSAYLEQSHIFIGIYWESYGWVAPEMEHSGLEDEYNLAVDQPKLIYIKAPAPDREERLAGLLKRISGDGVSYKTFRSPQELAQLVQDDLALLLTERFEGSPPVDQEDDEHLRSHVPATINRFVSRTQELDDLERLILHEGRRLVTLSGPGGVGKSRLAIEFAWQVKDHFPDGAHFVSLQSVTDPTFVVPTILHAVDIGEQFGGDPTDALMQMMAAREVLFVLDNFEHLLDAVLVVRRLVQECPGVRILTTSRRPLQLRGEIELALETLSLPPVGAGASNGMAKAGAVQLFVARAREVDPHFELTAENAHAVERICRDLDGLPLALELAAARTRLLSADAIADRLWDRFNLLKGGGLDLPDRHQTLKATIEWSIELLSEEDRSALRCCSTFAGSWSLEAIEGIFDPDGSVGCLDRLESLIENSLICRTDLGGEVRFSMLESVRQYAREQLTSDEAHMAERHARYFLECMTGAAYDGLRSAGQIETLDRLDADLENLRAALRWCSDHGEVEAVAKAGWSIWPFWWVRDHLSEGRFWMEEVVAHADEVEPMWLGRSDAIRAAMTFWQGEYGESVASLGRAEEHLLAAGDDFGLSLSQLLVGIIQAGAGDVPGGLKILARSREILSRCDDDWALGIALNATCLFGNALDSEELDDSLFEKAVEIWSRIGARAELGIALGNLGRRRAFRGALEEGKVAARDGLRMLAQARVKSGGSYVIEMLAEMAVLEGHHERAARLFGATEGIRARIANPPELLLAEKRARVMEEIRSVIGGDVADAACAAGGALNFTRAVAYALEDAS